jgi:hypothetical protein
LSPLLKECAASVAFLSRFSVKKNINKARKTKDE